MTGSVINVISPWRSGGVAGSVLQCSAVQRRTVHYSTVQYSGIHRPVQLSTRPSHSPQVPDLERKIDQMEEELNELSSKYSEVQCGTAQYRTVQYSAVQCITVAGG